MSTNLPLELKSTKPKYLQYPKEILTVGDEFRTMRLDKGLTKQEVGQRIGVNRNFVHELELNKHELKIYSLHKIYQFFGYVPKTLNIDESTLKGRLFTHRIPYEFTYSTVAKKASLDKSTLARLKKD